MYGHFRWHKNSVKFCEIVFIATFYNRQADSCSPGNGWSSDDPILITNLYKFTREKTQKLMTEFSESSGRKLLWLIFETFKRNCIAA